MAVTQTDQSSQTEREQDKREAAQVEERIAPKAQMFLEQIIAGQRARDAG